MSVAQLDRVTASDAVGSGFDSRRAHQNGSHPYGWLPFWHTRRKRTRRVRASEATLRRLVAGKAPWQAARYACRLACCACRSSSQKSRFAAIFGSPVLPLAGFRRCPTIPYIEKAALHGRLFQYKIINVIGTAFSFKARSLHSLRSVGMTKKTLLRIADGEASPDR